MDLKQRAAAVDARLKELYPRAAIALGYESDFQLLVAVILSAQTTDVGVNKVTPILFARFPTPEALAGADTPSPTGLMSPRLPRESRRIRARMRAFAWRSRSLSNHDSYSAVCRISIMCRVYP
jgi:hypothetical protein